MPGENVSQSSGGQGKAGQMVESISCSAQLVSYITASEAGSEAR